MSGRRRKEDSKKAPSSPSRRKRPAPPPPPPKALVTLLKKNKSVLTYFTSLQENLEADVRKWKERARHYQAQYEEQLAENETLKAAASSGSNKRKQRNGSDSSSEEDSEEEMKSVRKKSHKNSSGEAVDHRKGKREKGPPTSIHVRQQKAFKPLKGGEEGGETIDDSMFDVEPSSDEEDEEEKNGNFGKAGKSGAGDKKKSSKGDCQKSPADKVAGAKKSDIAASREEEEEVDDSMFHFGSDGDDDEQEEDASVEPNPKKKDLPGNESAKSPKKSTTKKSRDETKTDADTAMPFWREQQQFILSELLDAFQCLQHLGVELVERVEAEEGKETKEKTQDENGVVDPAPPQEKGDDAEEEGGFSFLPNESDTNALKQQIADDASDTQSLQQTKPMFKRRSNEDVVCDIVHSIRSLSRLQIQFKGFSVEYRPFRDPPHWIPCGDGQANEGRIDHPLYTAKMCLFQSLSVMDKYCGEGCLGLTHDVEALDPWEDLFNGRGNEPPLETDVKQAIQVGMQHRKGMVEQLVQSLYGEISSAWAVADRTGWMDKDYLVYDPESEAEVDIYAQDETASGEVDKSYQSMMMTPPGSKGQATLSTMAERRVLAQLLVTFLLLRNNSLKAFHLVCNYVVSAVPSLESGEHPKYPPVLSLVVLESMLSADKDFIDVGGVDNSNDKSPSRGEHSSYFGGILNNFQGDSQIRQSRIRRALSLSVHATALFWRQRLESNESRIADGARVEWACYLRLLESQASWLGKKSITGGTAGAPVTPQFDSLLDEQKDVCLQLIKETQHEVIEKDSEDSKMEANTVFSVSVALALGFLVSGDFRRPWLTFQSAVPETPDDPFACLPRPNSVQVLSSGCFMAFRESELRLQNKYRSSIGALDMIPEANPGGAFGKIYTLCLMSLLKCFRSAIAQKQPKAAQSLGQTLLHCCSLVSCGEIAYEVFDLLLGNDFLLSGSGIADRESLSMTGTLENVAQIPAVRVINMQRRGDRMNLMMSQAMQSGMLVLKAVAAMGKSRSLEHPGGGGDNNAGGNANDFLFGGHAIDGKVPIDEIAELIMKDEANEGHRRRLLEKKFVATQWRPHDLKAFDRNANDDESVLVRLSDSERACALSHISSWKGVVRSLSLEDNASSQRFLFRSSLRRLALSSGFARGQALDQRHSDMPPSPVCVVLEDDAILVDRFPDRLNDLLAELPRDFHFCSIGYSRPRTAPLVKFSTHVGIPTCIFYLTGYILSLEGAKHLLDSLPVCGPVDSWIGFKMIANWDNRFGAIVGVGNKTTVVAEPPSKKDLATILRFRAYAAMTPLCHQKVGGGSGIGVSAQNWRLRDSDIEYSGSANYSG